MPGSCEVCSSEPPKYRCPTCGLMSCSLACTQSHKIYCAPKAPSAEPTTDQQPPPETNGRNSDETSSAQNGLSLDALGSSPQLQELLHRYPTLRDQLQDIYKATLEEQWVEIQAPPRGRSFGKGKGPPRNRGPWTREKGFNRGLGKVRKLRERCEDGSEIGKSAEGFMRFMAVVNGKNEIQEPDPAR